MIHQESDHNVLRSASLEVRLLTVLKTQRLHHRYLIFLRRSIYSFLPRHLSYLLYFSDCFHFSFRPPACFRHMSYLSTVFAFWRIHCPSSHFSPFSSRLLALP